MGIYLNQNGEAKRFDGAPGPAASIAYDNTESGLLATNTQNAIDEVNDKVNDTISGNTVELSNTATQAHAVGEYFIWIGQFVKVTSAIEVGDTIVDGTNVEATSIADVLAAANGAIEGKQDKLTNPLTQSDVVNNLTSTATNVPLSAAMGKSLNGLINNLLKIATQTVTTTQLGTIGLTIPQDGKWILTISDSNKYGSFYIVKYNNTMYGAFHYAPPHDPLANTEITVTFIYV